MADPTKKPIDPRKKDEFGADELDAVTGGAIDAFLDFTDKGGTPTAKGEGEDTKK